MTIRSVASNASFLLSEREVTHGTVCSRPLVQFMGIVAGPLVSAFKRTSLESQCNLPGDTSAAGD